MEFKKLQKKIGYYFNNIELLKLALTHCSASNKHNERLEFLGDAILNFVISNALYTKFNNINEGDMSRMRSTLVREQTLSEIAKCFNLSKYLFLGNGEIYSGGLYRKSILSNTIEAIIGSIFLDSNIIIIQNLILLWYKFRLNNIIPGEKQKDPKTRLQEYLQEHHFPLPSYIVIDVKGKSHDQKFTIQCHISILKKPIIVISSSIKNAEQEAAKKMLIKLGIKI